MESYTSHEEFLKELAKAGCHFMPTIRVRVGDEKLLTIALLDTKAPENILSLHLFDRIKSDNSVIQNIVEPFTPRGAEGHYFIENVGRRVEINCVVSMPVLTCESVIENYEARQVFLVTKTDHDLILGTPYLRESKTVIDTSTGNIINGPGSSN